MRYTKATIFTVTRGVMNLATNQINGKIGRQIQEFGTNVPNEFELNFAHATNGIIRFEFSGFESRVDASTSGLPGGSVQSEAISTSI